MLLARSFGRSLRQLDIPCSASNRPLGSLSDATLQLLIENARLLEEDSGVVADGGGKAVIES